MEYKLPHPSSLHKIIHDLNSALFLIRGYADICKEFAHNPEKIRSNMDKLMEQTDNIEAIIQRLRQKQEILEPDH